MKKSFWNELAEELQSLKEQKGESTPAPLTPHEVFITFIKVAKQHNITADELHALLSIRDVTPTDLEILRDLQENP